MGSQTPLQPGPIVTRASTACALDRVVDHGGDPLVGVVRRRRAARCWWLPTPCRRSGRGRRSARGLPAGTPSMVNSVLSWRLSAALLARRQLDVAAEGRERRGVLPHVERRVDLAAQDHPVLVAAGRPGADRQGQEPGDARPGPHRCRSVTSWPWVLFTGSTARP